MVSNPAILLAWCLTTAGVAIDVQRQSFLLSAAEQAPKDESAKDMAKKLTDHAAQAKLQPRLRAKARNSETPSGNAPSGVALFNKTQQLTLHQYYDSVKSGRGIWKWSNALDAYDKHFMRFRGQPVRLGEVGLWSGGSILMWQAVLGAQCHVYGFDIMPHATRFNDAQTTVTIMDQADPVAWNAFFVNVSPGLDIMIDDGGHQPHQMLMTTQSVWPRLSQGGIMAVEDILGTTYLHSFFMPVANFYGARSHELASIHIYPLVLVAEKLAPWSVLGPQSPIPTQVTTLEELSQTMSTAAPGSYILLQNAAWGDFLSTAALTNFFGYFNELHAASTTSAPEGCHKTSNSECAYMLVTNDIQTRVTGVHIFRSQLVVEMAPSPPMIAAVRRGSDWEDYGANYGSR